MIDWRILHLKIRIVTTRPMTAATARLLLQRAVDTGRVPPGIEIRAIDWRKGGSESVVRAGREVPKALRDFYGAIGHAGTKRRFAVVKGLKHTTPKSSRRGKRQGPFRTTVNGRFQYRDAGGRFITRQAYQAQRKRFTEEEEELLSELRRVWRDADELDSGAELELTATTKGGTPRQDR